jgi:hypothetical protein
MTVAFGFDYILQQTPTNESGQTSPNDTNDNYDYMGLSGR